MLGEFKGVVGGRRVEQKECMFHRIILELSGYQVGASSSVCLGVSSIERCRHVWLWSRGRQQNVFWGLLAGLAIDYIDLQLLLSIDRVSGRII